MPNPICAPASVAFDVYDLNGDGKIDKTELRKLLDSALTENTVPLSDAQITELVETTFKQADVNRDGVVDREEVRSARARVCMLWAGA